MIRLAYIFWVTVTFLLGGCSRQVLVYHPQYFEYETATPSPAGLIFDPPTIAAGQIYGDSQANGVNLNTRPQREAYGGVYAGPQVYTFQIRSYDRHSDRRAGDGYFDRTARYYRTGQYVR